MSKNGIIKKEKETINIGSAVKRHMRKMKRIEKIFIKLAILMIGLTLTFSEKAFAAENEEKTERKQIIFLLDASKSMQKDGKWIEAADSACMIAATLPEEYEVALLVYNTEIIYQENFGNINQKTRYALETVEMQGYTTPAVALEKASQMFDTDATDKRVVFISDGEISVKGDQETEEAVRQFERAVDNAVRQKIKIDMFAIPNDAIENQICYGADITSGELYTADENHTIEEISATYLFQTLQIEKIELGKAISDEGNITADLQNTYMQNVKILFVSEEAISDFHVVGQCENLSMMRGNKFAVAKLENPLEKQVVFNYCLENKGNVYTYLLKEYYLETDMEKFYTAEDGSFVLKVEVLNHQGKPVLDAHDLENNISISIDGEQKAYDVESGTAVILYQADSTRKINVEVDISSSGNIIHYTPNTDIVELAVPVVEKPDYTVLCIVIVVLSAIIITLVIFYGKKQKKKSDDKTNMITVEEPETMIPPKYDFSGQLVLYLLKGEREEDIPPCSIKLFGRSRKSITFDWIKDRCGIDYQLIGADEIRFSGGKDHTLCFKNNGYATIVKENQILKREKKYCLYYGEKILLIFNNGETEMELHYKNMKPSER